MAKKKTSTKKHRFKHVESTLAERTDTGSVETGVAESPKAPARAVLATATGRDFSYVGADLKRTGILSVGLIALELVLYYAMLYTPVGEAIYRMVKV